MLSIKGFIRLSQWKTSKTVMAPGEKELIQSKDIFKEEPRLCWVPDVNADPSLPSPIPR